MCSPLYMYMYRHQ